MVPSEVSIQNPQQSSGSKMRSLAPGMRDVYTEMLIFCAESRARQRRSLQSRR